MFIFLNRIPKRIEQFEFFLSFCRSILIEKYPAGKGNGYSFDF